MRVEIAEASKGPPPNIYFRITGTANLDIGPAWEGISGAEAPVGRVDS